MRYAMMLTALIAWMGPLQVALGYQLKQTETGQHVRWHKRLIEVRFQASMAQTAAGQARMAAVRRSFQRWQEALKQRVQFQTANLTGVTQLGYDAAQPDANENTIAWVEDGWQEHPDSMAVTMITYREQSGEIVDADIAFNGEYYRWYVAEMDPGIKQLWAQGPTDPRPLIEVGNTAMHEIGHFLGLSHSEEEDATMFHAQEEREESKRELHADDLAAIAALYKEPIGAQGLQRSSFTQGEVPQVGCSSLPSPGQSPWGLALAALCLLGLWGRRRRLGVVACALGVGLLSYSYNAHATTAVAYDLPTIIQRAGLVVTGKVLSQRAAWRGRRIYTFSTIQVERCHKGRCSQRQVTVQQTGGVVRGVGMYIEGVKLLQPKQKVMLFLYSAHGRAQIGQQVRSLHRVVGLSQGVFRYLQSNGQTLLSSDRRGITWIDKSTRRSVPPTAHKATHKAAHKATHRPKQLVLTAAAMSRQLQRHRATTPRLKHTRPASSGK